MSHTGPEEVPVPRGNRPIAPDSWLARAASLLLFLALAVGLVVPKLAGAAYLLLGLISIIWLEPGVVRGRLNLDGHDRLMLFASVLFVTR